MRIALCLIVLTLLLSACKNEKKSCCEISNNKNRIIPQKAHSCENINKQSLLLTDESFQNKKAKDSFNISKMASSTIKSSMILIPEGEYLMGSNGNKWTLSRELPQHKVKISAFYMDEHEVTNAQFAKFVQETNYLTLAEKNIDWEEMKKQLPANTPKFSDEDLKPGSLVFTAPKNLQNKENISQWWVWKRGANWKHPFGPKSNLEGKENHPVTQIAYTDVLAYAKWAGKRLPTEAEWEWAARGGLDNKTYPWGNEHVGKGKAKCNYWTGDFPIKNTKIDGYYYSAPVKSYPPNGYGLYDMAGNVWEFCSDFLDINYYSSFDKNSVAINPQGAPVTYYPQEGETPKRVLRGGSFLCNDSYCASYRVSARMATSEDSGMNHVGFRLVKGLELVE